jgi:hypothetical protein
MAGTADRSTSLRGIAQECDRGYRGGTARRPPPPTGPPSPGGPFNLVHRTPEGSKRQDGSTWPGNA